MLARILSAALVGVEATIVEVEVDVGRGLPGTQIVGLAETAVRESRERVRAAIANSGYRIPAGRTTINLAPADLRKEGSAYDLPIALGLLAAAEGIALEALAGSVVLGELSLDGRVKPIHGALPVAAAVARRKLRALILPSENAPEGAVVPDIEVQGVATLGEAFEILCGRRHPRPFRCDPAAVLGAARSTDLDLTEVHGQQHAKRALEVAAAGGHNLLFIGPPGAGKTMLARRLPTILPSPTLEETIESTKIHSVAGLLDGPLLAERPFRAPHHTISGAGLVGGGAWPRPGEASLAHNGVLFLDELPEYPRNVLEALRQPLEERRITLSRAQTTLTFPASFVLVAAMNPCPCGYWGDPRHECRCVPGEVRRYRARVSGPLLDRIDLHVEVPAVPWRDLSSARDGEPSVVVRERVERARSTQRRRLARRRTACNAQMTQRDLRRFCVLEPAGETLLASAVERLGLSARAYGRVLKLARTVADLAASEAIGAAHIAEAIQYRALDRTQ